MTSPATRRDQAGSRPSTPSRARTAVESLLSAGIVGRGSARPPSTRQMERSASSMADSFPAARHDAPTPISHWAHLTYMTSQRNTLRTELRAHQIAGAQARRSVAALRRLALRMAVSISVKERQLATSARTLATTRQSSYLAGRHAEKRVEALARALRVEEGRTRDMLEALERASMLTLQCLPDADPAEPQLRRPRNPLSPPPSPPTRRPTLAMTAVSGPRTPPRSTASSWNDADWALTPGIESPADRESDQALAACRRRISHLQAECAKSKDDARLLQESKTRLETDTQEHQSRIAALEAARAAVEETLASTRLQLEVSTGLETSLKQRLRLKTKELASLEQSSEGRQEELSKLVKEKDGLMEQLTDRDTQLDQLHARTVDLQHKLKTVEDKLHVVGQEELALQNQLKEKESANAELVKRLERGSKYEQILQKKIAEHEQEILGNIKKIDIGGGLISSLREQIKQSEGSKKDTEQALTTLRTELTSLDATRTKDLQERDRLALDLSAAQTSKNNIEGELRTTQDALTGERAEKSRLLSDLDSLRFQHDELCTDLQAAQRHIHYLERTDDERQADLELLQDEKASIEADLREARQAIFSLRESERMRNLEKQIAESKERESLLQTQLDEAREAQNSANQSRDEENPSLEASENNDLDKRLNESLRLQTDVQTELDSEGLKTRVTELEQDLGDREQSKIDAETRLSVVNKRDLQQAREEMSMAEEVSRTQREGTETDVTQLREQLDVAEQVKKETESRLAEIATAKTDLKMESEASQAKSELSDLQRDTESLRRSNASDGLKEQLQANGSLLGAVEAQVAELKSKLSASQEELEQSRALSDHARLQEDFNMARQGQLGIEDLQSDLASAQTRLNELEHVEGKLTEALASQSTLEHDLESTCTRLREIATMDEDLAALRNEKAQIEQQSGSKDADFASATMAAEAAKTVQEVSELRDANGRLEEKLGEAIGRTTGFKNDLQTALVALTSKIGDTNNDLDSLREANTRLTDSEKDMVERLSTAEKDLQNVRETNERLEAFLERVEKEMGYAETAFEDSEKRLEEFVKESQIKLDAARNAKLKYKLTDNTDLRHKIGAKTEQLLEKDKFRMRSMNTAYNELRSRYEHQLRGHGPAAKRPQRKRAMTDGQPTHKPDMNSSYAALEREVQGLREDKQAFETLVATLQDKIRQLQDLEEWQEPEEQVQDSVPSTPTTRSSRPTSALSARPTTGASTVSRVDDSNAWASEVERIRTLRNEQAIQLKNNKQARHDLRKNLKDTKSQLHHLEKHKASKPYAIQYLPTLLRQNMLTEQEHSPSPSVPSQIPPLILTYPRLHE
ncbi:hypothetical protein BDU57DRAFT_557820 [Ampelomyces quisqualis]|uniref:Uncharacterized protein n=1 Tax=Ampelomyces quisqualis TaxID=50730 RepID=A0A6A5QJ69_AMPQU|nr:hypothetical protein BDU57DRAFT_557820 [Ampelomyces quisqualis]